MTPSVHFFIPRDQWPLTLPSGADDYWPWTLRERHEYGAGRYVVTVRTCVELQAAGFPCEVTDTVPQDGIVITHVDFLPHTEGTEPWDRRPRFESWLDEAFVVAYQADRPRHPYGNLRLVQNRADALALGLPRSIRSIRPRMLYMPYWSQPGLVPRDEDRGEEFVNVGFFGNPGEIDPSLTDRAWLEHMRGNGFTFQIHQVPEWHDYSHTDVVLAVRSFTYRGDWLWKPASKLYNAWLAGVPAVLGHESAYWSERQSELDYIEVGSRAEVEAALVRLRENRDLRSAMVEHGRRRSPHVSAQGITRRWQRILEGEAFPAFERWRRSSKLERRRGRWQDGARVRAERAISMIAMTRRRSRDLISHRKDWN